MADEEEVEEGGEEVAKGQKGEQARAMQNLDGVVGAESEIDSASAQKVGNERGNGKMCVPDFFVLGRPFRNFKTKRMFAKKKFSQGISYLHSMFLQNVFLIEFLRKEALAKVQVNKSDVELIVNEFDISSEKADVCLRENGGDVVAALKSLLR